MTAWAEKIYDEMLDLPADERLSLMDKLLHHLNLPTQSDIDQAWAEEAERRDQEIDQGIVTLIPAETVLVRVKAKLLK